MLIGLNHFICTRWPE